jgi:hypothetical protein
VAIVRGYTQQLAGSTPNSNEQRRVLTPSGHGRWLVWLQVGALLPPLGLEGIFEHAHLALELFVDSLCVTALALVLCDLGLHLGSLNVPRVAGPLVVVPFDLEETHDACVLRVSRGQLALGEEPYAHTLQGVLGALRRVVIVCLGGIRGVVGHAARLLVCHG